MDIKTPDGFKSISYEDREAAAQGAEASARIRDAIKDVFRKFKKIFGRRRRSLQGHNGHSGQAPELAQAGRTLQGSNNLKDILSGADEDRYQKEYLARRAGLNTTCTLFAAAGSDPSTWALVPANSGNVRVTSGFLKSLTAIPVAVNRYAWVSAVAPSPPPSPPKAVAPPPPPPANAGFTWASMGSVAFDLTSWKSATQKKMKRAGAAGWCKVRDSPSAFTQCQLPCLSGSMCAAVRGGGCQGGLAGRPALPDIQYTLPACILRRVCAMATTAALPGEAPPPPPLVLLVLLLLLLRLSSRASAVLLLPLNHCCLCCAAAAAAVRRSSWEVPKVIFTPFPTVSREWTCKRFNMTEPSPSTWPTIPVAVSGGLLTTSEYKVPRIIPAPPSPPFTSWMAAATACSASCAANADCTEFSFTVRGSTPTCSVFTAANRPVMTTGLSADVTISSSSGNDVVYGTGLSGGDLKTVTAPTARDCSKECSKEPNCSRWCVCRPARTCTYLLAASCQRCQQLLLLLQQPSDQDV